MKKLMIAAAIVCAAAFAQAATVKWSAANAYAGNTTDKLGPAYTAYFVSSADYSYANAKNAFSGDSVDLAFLSTYGRAAGAFKENPSTHAPLGTAGATITETAGNSETWTGYLVIIDSDSIDTATKAYLSTEASKATGDSGQTATLAWTSLNSGDSSTQLASNWKAVPEPTSGLLLLLGVAGLALKRRRA